MNCDRNSWRRFAATATVTLAFVVAVIVSVAAIEPRVGPARIAYVSIQKVAAQSTELQASSKRLQQFRDEKARAIAEKQKAFDALRLQVAQLGGVFQASKRAKAQRDEQRARSELQALQNEAQTELQKMQREAQADFQRELSTVVGELAKQRGADIVLNEDVSVVWAHPGMDWTSEVVQRINASGAH
jgi:Skp family chaperone for outer membrane proteins